MTELTSAKAFERKNTDQTIGNSQERSPRAKLTEPNADILDLQRAAGNRAVNQLAQPGPDSVPLSGVNAPDTAYQADPTTRPATTSPLIKRILTTVRRAIDEADNGRWVQVDQIDKQRGLAGLASDWYSNVEPPYTGMWTNAKGHLQYAERNLTAGNLRGGLILSLIHI